MESEQGTEALPGATPLPTEAVVLAAPGPGIDSTRAQALQRELLEHIRCGRVRLVLDLQDLHRADSFLMGVLVAVARTARESGGDLKLSGVYGNVRTLILASRMDRVLDVCTDVPDALRRFGSLPGPPGNG